MYQLIWVIWNTKYIPFPAYLNDLVKFKVVKEDVHNSKQKNIEDKIPYITNLATNTTLNAKINKVKNKIPNIS